MRQKRTHLAEPGADRTACGRKRKPLPPDWTWGPLCKVCVARHRRPWVAWVMWGRDGKIVAQSGVQEYATQTSATNTVFFLKLVIQPSGHAEAV